MLAFAFRLPFRLSRAPHAYLRLLALAGACLCFLALAGACWRTLVPLVHLHAQAYLVAIVSATKQIAATIASALLQVETMSDHVRPR